MGSSSKVPNSNSGNANILLYIACILLVFFAVDILGSMYAVAFNKETEAVGDKVDIYNEYIVAAADKFETKCVTNPSIDGYSSNGIYIDENGNIFLDLTDITASKRYIVGITQSDVKSSEAEYSMSNEFILNQDEKFKEHVNDLDKIKKYTEFNIEEYSLEDTEGFERISYNYDVYRQLKDFPDKKYVEDDTAESQDVAIDNVKNRVN